MTLSKIKGSCFTTKTPRFQIPRIVTSSQLPPPRSKAIKVTNSLSSIIFLSLFVVFMFMHFTMQAKNHATLLIFLFCIVLCAAQDRPCSPEFGWVRPGHTYNDPSTFRTATAIECCMACRAAERCITWSRHKVNGGCALKDTAAPAYIDGLYDAGFIQGTDASSVVPLSSCYMETGASYPGGNVIARVFYNNHIACCHACRSRYDCYSWHYNYGTRNCVMNSNVPPRVQRGSDFAGAINV